MRRSIFFILSLFLQLHFLTPVLNANDNKPSTLLADWINIQLKLVRTTKGVPHPAYSRHFSYTAIAFYESVIPGYPSFRTLGAQLNELPMLPTYSGHQPFVARASANAAYAAMMRHFYGINPNASLIDSFENAVRASFTAQGISAESIQSSANFGRAIADLIIRWSGTDGFDKIDASYAPPEGDGMWQPTPSGYAKPAVPHWRNNRRLVNIAVVNVRIPDATVYSALPNSPHFLMVKEVYDVSQSLTDEQKRIALFWDDAPGNNLTVPGHWSSIMAQVIVAQKLSLMKGAEAFVKMNISLHDACIATFIAKYTYSFARPVTNIRKTIKADWSPLIETPNHPEFPAAHATFSSAAATGLTIALGKNISFTDGTYTYHGMQPRSFKSFEEAAREAGMSRLYGGIHYRTSIEEGLKLGKRTAQDALAAIKFH
jgi:hypothetical protein